MRLSILVDLRLAVLHNIQLALVLLEFREEFIGGMYG